MPKNSNSGAWLNAVPSKALGLELSPATCRVVWRWWLGELLYGACNESVVCPFCRGCADCYGDHILCCDKAEFTTRHEAVVSQLTHFLQAAGLSIQNNVGVGGRERPADILVTRWTDNEPVAVDVTITHPLAPHLGVNQTLARAALRAKERQKIAKYSPLLQNANLNFVPFPVTTFGELSPQAADFVDDASTFFLYFLYFFLNKCFCFFFQNMKKTCFLCFCIFFLSTRVFFSMCFRARLSVR